MEVGRASGVTFIISELQRTDPGTKVTGELSTKDRISHLMPKMDFYYLHRFSWKKYTKIIGHMPWLDQ